MVSESLFPVLHARLYDLKATLHVCHVANKEGLPLFARCRIRAGDMTYDCHFRSARIRLNTTLSSRLDVYRCRPAGSKDSPPHARMKIHGQASRVANTTHGSQAYDSLDVASLRVIPPITAPLSNLSGREASRYVHEYLYGQEIGDEYLTEQRGASLAVC